MAYASLLNSDRPSRQGMMGRAGGWQNNRWQEGRTMRRMLRQRVWCMAITMGWVIVVGVSLPTECRGDDTVQTAKTINPGLLPADPAEWVCASSLIEATTEQINQWCQMHPDRGQPAPVALRTPTPLSALAEKNAYDEAFQIFLRDRVYATTLQWQRDFTWRLTGPYVGPIGGGQSFGVHPAVRIYYSPEMIDWLCDGRQGTIPNGAMIIKEMHPITPGLDIGIEADGCMELRADVEPTSWTVMVRADQASFDGWYWA